MPEHEHDEYELYEGAEYAPAYETRDYEPANDSMPEAEADTIDTRLGGEKDEWATEDHGESGYIFDGAHVIGPDGVSWLAAWGESVENIALYDEMIMSFKAGETSFQLPDYTEHRNDGEILFKTFMLLNEDGSVGYEIHKHELMYANDNEPLLFDDEDETDGEQDRTAMNDSTPESLASDMPEAAADEMRTAEAALAFTADDAAPVAEHAPYAPFTEQAAAETTAHEHIAHVEEPRTQEEHGTPTLRETPAQIAVLLETVTYHAETVHTVAASAEATAVVEHAPEAEILRTETVPEIVQTMVEHRYEPRDILDIIPNLPTYANRDREPSAAAVPEVRAENAPIPSVIRAEAVVLAAETAVMRESVPAAAAQPAARETPQSVREQVLVGGNVPEAKQRTPMSTAEPKTGPRRETPRTAVRAPEGTEHARGGSAQARRSIAAPRHALAETRAAAPDTTHPLARIMRGREIVHPARQAANAHRWAHAQSVNDNAPRDTQRLTHNGITLHRAA